VINQDLPLPKMNAARLHLVAPPTRMQVLGLYKEMVKASRNFRLSDPQWFLRRVRQEFYKTDREPAERIKWFQVLARRSPCLRPTIIFTFIF
jgi:hypothetical protein